MYIVSVGDADVHGLVLLVHFVYLAAIKGQL